ncbi:MAG: hypothetical protein DUW69_000596 [Verrucomicrobia bacterium]|nr:MAG: hypothetical protein DUW69_000596 [Verrucomicrobiota bacterium]
MPAFFAPGGGAVQRVAPELLALADAAPSPRLASIRDEAPQLHFGSTPWAHRAPLGHKKAAPIARGGLKFCE